MIFITNTLYLSEIPTLGSRPLLLWNTIIRTDNYSIDSSTTERPETNLWSPDTSQYWEADTTGTVTISIDNDLTHDVDCLAIARHNFGSGGISYTLQESEDGSTWTDILTDQLVQDDAAIIHYFDETDSPQFRLVLTPQSVAPRIAHMKLGKGLIMPRKIYVGHTPTTLAPKARRIVNGSENGQYLGQIVTRRWLEDSCEQENIKPAWVRNYLTPFINHTQHARDDDDTPQGPFFYAWRPADYPREVIYGWTDENIEPQNQRPNGMMQFSFNMQGVK